MKRHVIGVVSGKGGVGKTTVAMNLATSLAILGKRTVLIDTNVGTSHLGISLGMKEPPVTLNKLLKTGGTQIINAAEEYIENLYVIPSDIPSTSFTWKDLSKLNDVIRRIDTVIGPDYIILDSAPGIGVEARATISHSDELLFVATPDVPSVADIIRIKEMSSKKKKGYIGIVLNMVRGKGWEVKVEHIEKSTGLPVVQIVPFDKAVLKSLARTMPVVLAYPHARSSRAFRALASKISGSPDINYTVLSGFTGYLKRLWIDLFG